MKDLVNEIKKQRKAQVDIAKKVKKTPTGNKNQKSYKLRELILALKSDEYAAIFAKAKASDIGIPTANLRRYVISNLDRVQRENPGFKLAVAEAKEALAETA